MLEASGARLERLEVHIPPHLEVVGDGLVHVAQALRRCSPTLKDFYLTTNDGELLHPLDTQPDYASQVERLREQWADVLAGVSACRELQVLVLSAIPMEPLFPPGTAFARLTHLELFDSAREHPPGAGVMGLWEMMASGGLPALAKLGLMIEGRWGGVEKVRSRVAPGLEAVAGTLTYLHLERFCNWVGDEVEMGYELGVAVGKLQRLKDMGLNLFYLDGRAYQAFAQGLAASGGGRPLPRL
jgi:hypothetical protein